MSFQLREHTADVAVEATAPSVGGVFAAVADGLAAAACESVPGGGQRFSLVERADDREAALFDYLDRLIYERDVRGVLPVDNEATVRAADGEWVVEATARGVPLDSIDGREIKGVTYSEMVLEERGDEWYAYVVFDV